MDDRQFDDLVADAILTAVEQLGYSTDGRLIALNSYENRVYQVGLEEAAPVVVKFYRAGRWSNAQILEEHQFTAELSEAQLPVISPLVIQGTTLHRYNGFRFSVFPNQGGRSPDLGRVDELERIGRLMGRLHAVSSVRPFKHRPSVDLERYFHEPMKKLLAQSIPQTEQSSFRRVFGELSEKIDQQLS